MQSIEQTLTQRFAAPLPDFYQRRIIFWQDEEREFEQENQQYEEKNTTSAIRIFLSTWMMG